MFLSYTTSMFDKLKQLKDLRDQAKNIQSALNELIVVEAQGGVTVTMNGNMDVLKIDIARADDPNLGEAVKGAMNRAIKEAQQKAADYMRTNSGLNLSGLL